MSGYTTESVQVLKAIDFAADKHRLQKRKDKDASPYVNHPIKVAFVLSDEGKVHNLAHLQAAILHDTIEDTETTPEELEQEFGTAVRDLVLEVTDDKTLEKQERKRLQIEHAPHLSDAAKQIKLADKICNVVDITHSPPADWPLERKLDYLTWAENVVAGCRGVNAGLERRFDEVIQLARLKFSSQ
jgi:guanosine-3',5'-bis(diphosphate) 3'-pyrophosphohydrolase